MDDPTRNGPEGAPADVATAADLIGHGRAADVAPVELTDGRTAYVRIMTLAELEVFQGGWEGDSRRESMARIILATACDRAGNLLFRPDQLDDVRQIRGRDALLLSNHALKINLLTEEAIAPVKKDSPEIIENG